MANYSFRSESNDDGRQSSLSVQGESMGRQTPGGARKSYKYRVVSHNSSVDELLFASHNSRNRSHGNEDDWRDSPPQRASSRVKTSPAIKPQLTASTSMPKTRNKYRVAKHTPTYVDHSLFGPALEEPSFEAPWTDKKADKRRSTPLMWGPPVQGSLEFDSYLSGDSADRQPSSGGGRPRSASGGSGRRPGSAVGGRRSSAGSRPQSASGRRSATPNKPPPWK